MRISNITFLWCVLLVWTVRAQSPALVMAHATSKETTNYDPAKEIEGTLLLPTSFGKIDVANIAHARLLDEVEPYRVELVYSKYPKTTNFQNIQQRRLNLSRLEALQKIAPQLFEPNVEWEFVAHVVHTADQARELYHGFVVYYNPKEKPQKEEEEGTPTPTPETPVPTYAYNPDSEEARFLRTGKPTKLSTYQVFERQNWKDVVVVCDWTASMYHVATPVLLWHHERNQKQDTSSSILNFVFFNDGDNKPTEEKKIGQTGGIYATSTSSVEEALALMEKSKQAGAGGDFPENDIEALLYAQQNYPKAQALVLIADNMAAVRDIELLHQLKKPIHVIITRVDEIDQIRKEYWDIVVATSGTMHTLQQDISLEEAIEYKKRLETIAAMSKRQLKKFERKQRRKLRRHKGKR